MLNFRVTAQFKYTDGRSDAKWELCQPHSIEQIKFLIQSVLTDEPVPSSFVVTIVPFQLRPCDEAMLPAAMRAHPHLKEIEPGNFEWTGEAQELTTFAIIERFRMSHSYEARRIEAETQRIEAERCAAVWRSRMPSLGRPDSDS